MVWTQVTANLLIGVAYAAIAATLAVLVRRIKNIPFAWVYLAFGTFILSCGLTHFFDIITVWHPIYWADAGVRVVTATASVATALLLVPLLPRAAALAEDARLSNERGRKLEVVLADLETAHAKLAASERFAQQRARASEGQVRLLVETMPQLSWIADSDGKTTFRNTRWQEYTGLDLEDPADAGWQACLDPETLEQVKRLWLEALSTKTYYEVEGRFRRADGESRWFLVRASPLLDDAGNVSAWMGTCTDIHDQRMLHDEALRTARMKDEFLATVSHELRTPLNAILGWSRLLKEGAVSSETREKAIDSVHRNALAQTRLVDDLLDVSRIITGKMLIHPALTNPASAVEAALDAVRPAAVAKGLHLNVSIDRDAGPVMADAGRVQQIIWNLVGNAVKFTPTRGHIKVGVARVDEHVAITVADDGIGIQRDFVSHLFRRFSQADGSIRRSHGGLGLGLAITKHLVELHGGEISVYSGGDGQGATFTVTLPRAEVRGRAVSEAVPEEAATAAAERPELLGLRLLLVEDDIDSREVVSAILADIGVEVTSAETAEQALALLAQVPIDVILSDVGLPGKDGYAFIRAVRESRTFGSIPAAALTAFANTEDRRRALEAGFQRHLRKPFDQAELVAVIAELKSGTAKREQQ
ncbi:MAG: ATP-binding protein [Polyangiaceae bacterium]